MHDFVDTLSKISLILFYIVKQEANAKNHKVNRVVFLGNMKRLLTTVVSRWNTRQFALWDQVRRTCVCVCGGVNLIWSNIPTGVVKPEITHILWPVNGPCKENKWIINSLKYKC